HAGNGVGGVPDLPLAAAEDQDVARSLGDQLVDRLADRLHLVARLGVLVVVGLRQQRTVAHLDRVGPAGDLDDRGVAEVPREPVRIDRGRGDDQLQVRAFGQEIFEYAQDEVDVQT